VGRKQQRASAVQPFAPDHAKEQWKLLGGDHAAHRRGLRLSRRERQVTQPVLLSLSTKDIADKLFISVHTEQDHLKAIFDKVDVSSRRQLVAKLGSDCSQLAGPV
jgi:DNA-binding CsgD family transcriptional regulator